MSIKVSSESRLQLDFELLSSSYTRPLTFRKLLESSEAGYVQSKRAQLELRRVVQHNLFI
ncbi:hypothetical protein BDZ94DRAFT_806951 [Collybia nuda]|uniref:Uncharacterized protein n=1 Tax=Collybia nuda TaxID=64659 RepID=A0A9P6CI35_9AGAR|nr:hypothetical protein BDZ94DRAFT_806951 [Collybia nuda]